MATSATTGVIEHLRAAALLRDGAWLGDGELLGRFVERHDEAALAALVKRHGSMVWGVCRRLLSHHDAEDAFQATFIVLARKAESVVPREMVGNWLYGVAHQTALQARRAAARRRAREVQVTQMPDKEAARQDQWADVRLLLDQELSRLPDHYRAVIVLCDLEGRTRKEAARQLGCPEGTVAGRLARARTMLGERLNRRGVMVPGGAVLTPNVASAAVPNSVASATIKAATLVAAGQAAAAGAISGKVTALTEGVLKAMLLTKPKIASAVLLFVAVAIAGVGASGLLHQTQAGEQPKAQRVPEKGDKESQPAAKNEEKPKPPVEKDAAHTFRSDVRELKIPVRIVPGLRAKIKRLHLNVSMDQGKTWQKLLSIPPTADAFLFRAPKDGTYWFAVQAETLDGRTDSADPPRPDLKIVVDTVNKKAGQGKDNKS